MVEISTCPDGRIRLRAFGEFDYTAATSLRHLSEDTVRQGVRLVVDLGCVDSVDGSGISALVGTVRRVRSLGGRVEIVNPRRRVTAMLRLAGVHDLLFSSNTTTDDVA